MSIAQFTPAEIEYPSSDDQPMGETPIHRQWMIYIDEIFKRRYRGQKVYLGSDMLVYYVPGDITKYIVPDNFVALGCDDPERDRDVWKTWEDGVPTVAIEVTSKGSRKRDKSHKPTLYASIGIKETFLYDPRAVVKPALQGWRLKGNRAEPIEPNARGELKSRELEITLRLEGRELILTDGVTKEKLITNAQADAFEAAANMARAKTAEDELRRLRESLKERGIDPDA